MAQHYQSRHSQKSSGKKALLICLIAIVAAALIGAGIFVYFNFFAKPDTDPAPYSEPTATSAEATIAPTAAPTEPAAADKAKAYISGMSDREKLCQLFIVTPEVLTGEYGVTLAGEQTKASLEKYPVGGIVYFAENLVDPEQTKTMIANSQSYAKTPLFIGVDEEGGDVARCADKLGTTKFEPMFNYKQLGAQTAYNNAKTIGTDIKGFGFNLDFAPVADVWTNPDNTVIADRAYSDDFSEAATLVAMAVKGFNDSGVIPTLKHFPGHGDTYEDSHNGAAYLKKNADELKNGELLPFRSGIDAGTGMVMIGHLTVGDMDAEKPATLSSEVVPKLLRGELGYNGVAVTDSMSMQAVTDNYSYDEMIKGIFDADIDLILCPDDLDAYLTAIETALNNGTITQEQLDAKLLRILTLKFERGLIK